MKKSVYMNLDDLKAVELLKDRWDVGKSEAIRRAVAMANEVIRLRGQQ